MDIFNVLTMIGGLCLFLFGMNIMGQALERKAGNKLRLLLGKLTTGKFAGMMTGLGITAVIQSSSATTVMVVGFVNSGLMSLKQAINVIIGANVGTTVTAWVLSLAGVQSGNMFIKLLKPSSFTPVLALIGVVFYIFCKNSKRKDTGMILLGFSTLMFGMQTMSDAVSGLGDIPAFQNLFLLFQNPILGVIAGAVLTAIIQSSSASVGVLQALAVTGKVTFGAAVPIIMGQNIGTCVTAMLSSVGANKNAKRAAMVHLSFNVIGTAFGLIVYCLIKELFAPVFLNDSVTQFGIAVTHSAFNVFCTVLILPFTGLLETLVNKMMPDSRSKETKTELDERLFATPSIALERCHSVASDMAQNAVQTLKEGMSSLYKYTPALAESIRMKEDITDRCEDMLGTYLVHLSTKQISEQDSNEATKLLKIIGDFERIADHGVNLLVSAEEMKEKNITLSEAAKAELRVITSAVDEILDLALSAFLHDDLEAAFRVEPLEQVIDVLKEKLRTSHILRMQQKLCSIDTGFIWSDLLTNLERTSDHCSNIAGCMIDIAHHNMNIHESLREMKNNNDEFRTKFNEYSKKYTLGT